MDPYSGSGCEEPDQYDSEGPESGHSGVLRGPMKRALQEEWV